MSISFQCSDCQSKYRVDDSFAGKKAKCKKCGNQMRVPEPVAAVADEGLEIRVRDDSAAPEHRQPVNRPAAGRPAAAKPAPARPSQTRPAQARPSVKQAAPVAPPADDYGASFDDLAALGTGELLPEAPPLPRSTPPKRSSKASSTPSPSQGPTLGYATPQRPVVVQPAYVEQYAGLLILATLIGPTVRVLLGVIAASMAGLQIDGGAAVMAIGVGGVVGAAAVLIFGAPLVLIGIKIAGAIMKFSTEPGGYKNVLVILGWGTLVGLVGQLLQLVIGDNILAMVILAVVSLAGSIRLLKDTFALTWAQTAVAAASIVTTIIVIIGGIVVAVAASIGGVGKMLDKYL